MRHRVTGKRLSRSTSHRKAMRRNMAASLIQHGAIRTTAVKAKELRRFVERIITIAKKGTLHARRQVLAELGDRAMIDPEGDLQDKSLVQKLFDEIAPRYADRPGGYTRIIRLEESRIGDSGRQVILQLVEEGSERSSGPRAVSRRGRRSAKRRETAQEAMVPEEEPAEEEPQEEPEEEPEEEEPGVEEPDDEEESPSEQSEEESQDAREDSESEREDP